MKFTSKQWLIIVIVAVVIIGSTILAVWAYRKGKLKAGYKQPPLDNPVGGEDNNPYGISQGEILAIVEALHNDMDGLNWGYHNSEPYEKLNILSDTDFVNVYNVFNDRYLQESGQTLKQWIEAEIFGFDDIVEAIKLRMGRLNLK